MDNAIQIDQLMLTAADGHRLGALRARPQGKPVGGIVVLQEIFGLNGQRTLQFLG